MTIKRQTDRRIFAVAGLKFKSVAGHKITYHTDPEFSDRFCIHFAYRSGSTDFGKKSGDIRLTHADAVVGYY